MSYSYALGLVRAVFGLAELQGPLGGAEGCGDVLAKLRGALVDRPAELLGGFDGEGEIGDGRADGGVAGRSFVLL